MYFRQRQRTQLEEVEIPEPDKWEVSTVKLVPGKEIGRGAFGTVRRGIARDLSEDLRGEIPYGNSVVVTKKRCVYRKPCSFC